MKTNLLSSGSIVRHLYLCISFPEHPLILEMVGDCWNVISNINVICGRIIPHGKNKEEESGLYTKHLNMGDNMGLQVVLA